MNPDRGIGWCLMWKMQNKTHRVGANELMTGLARCPDPKRQDYWQKRWAEVQAMHMMMFALFSNAPTLFEDLK
ncbi:hypothetical protein [Caudoviricetes sp.]|nr:hypothetical protein [Caudoviricetes sp.]